MRSAKFLVISFLLWCAAEIFAQQDHAMREPLHKANPQCPTPSTAHDVVACVREHHVNVRKIRLALEPALAYEGVARQVSNPEFQSMTTLGASQGSVIAQSENSILQTIELGGKRAARIKEAQSQRKQIDCEVTRVQAEVTLEAVLKLHRVRLLNRELVIISDTIKAFSELISQIKSRPTRSSEQDVTLGIYEMALSDAMLKEASLQDEEREIAHYFQLNGGFQLTEIKAVLPAAPQSWPVVQEATLSSPELLRLKADREVAFALLGSAKATSWPDLSLGPAYVLNADKNEVQHLFGLQLSIPLPLFQSNEGGRAYAQKLIAKAEESISLSIAKDSLERAERLRAYNSAIHALDKSMTSAQIERRYQKMQKALPRGLIPSALIMEAHRQRYDAERNRNDYEFRAIKALWEIYQYDGRIFEESL